MQGKVKWFLLLHVLLGVYSTGGIFSKLAGKQPFFSFAFLFFYGCMLMLLVVYAVGWQQIIKHIPLTVAYANKAVTICWGILYGCLFFREAITLQQLLGAAMIIAGVILYVRADGEETA